MLLTALIFFRAPLYRSLIGYKVDGHRDVSGRTGVISHHRAVDLQESISAALDTVADLLEFTNARVSNDPTLLKEGSKANCIGYAALFTHLLKEALPENEYSIEHQVARLHLGSFDLHSITTSPFWADHDIVTVVDLRTEERISVDPTLYDATGIWRVRAQE